MWLIFINYKLYKIAKIVLKSLFYQINAAIINEYYQFTEKNNLWFLNLLLLYNKENSVNSKLKSEL